MAPLPKRKLSKARGRRREDGHLKKALITGQLIKCPNCHKLTLSHRICKECGFYRGKKVSFKEPKVIDPKKK